MLKQILLIHHSNMWILECALWDHFNPTSHKRHMWIFWLSRSPNIKVPSSTRKKKTHQQHHTITHRNHVWYISMYIYIYVHLPSKLTKCRYQMVHHIPYMDAMGALPCWVLRTWIPPLQLEESNIHASNGSSAHGICAKNQGWEWIFMLGTWEAGVVDLPPWKTALFWWSWQKFNGEHVSFVICLLIGATTTARCHFVTLCKVFKSKPCPVFKSLRPIPPYKLIRSGIGFSYSLYKKICVHFQIKKKNITSYSSTASLFRKLP